MADFANLFTGILGLSQIQAGADIAQVGFQRQAQTIIQGGEISAKGALLTASGFRQSALATSRASSFNLQIDDINTKRKLSAVSRQFQRTIGTQLSQQAASNLSVTSKSFLQVQSETRGIFETGLLNIKIDAENQRRSNLFEGNIKQIQLEDQARAAEFRAASTRVLSRNRAAEAAFQGEIAQFRSKQQQVKGISTLLSQAFSAGGVSS